MNLLTTRRFAQMTRVNQPSFSTQVALIREYPELSHWYTHYKQKEINEITKELMEEEI